MSSKNSLHQCEDDLEDDLNEKFNTIKDIITTFDEPQNIMNSLDKLIKKAKRKKFFKSKKNVLKNFLSSLKQLRVDIFSGVSGKILGVAIFLEILILILEYVLSKNNFFNNFINSPSNYDFMRHFKLVIPVFPIILLIFIAFLYLYKLFKFDSTESQQPMSKKTIIFVNIGFILIFLVAAMFYPWSIIEPIITVATAIILPYIFWLDKEYK